MQYWAKTTASPDGQVTCHLLPYHLLDTAAVCHEYLQQHSAMRTAFARAFGCSETTAQGIVCFATALHDLGKFAEAFQGKVPWLFEELHGRPPACFGGPPHDVLSSLMWRRMLPTIAEMFAPPLCSNHDLLNDVLQFVYEPSAGHHGKPVTALDVTGAASVTAFDANAAGEFTSFVQHLLLAPHAPIKLVHTANELRVASWRLAGLIVLCDWIASAEEFFPYLSTPVPLQEYWQTRALPSARAALEKAGVLPAAPSRLTGMKALFPAIPTPTALQCFAEQCTIPNHPQLFIIEDLTGSGKTEAALVLAHRLMALGFADGLYFALPTMATANAMYDRLAAAYERLYEPTAHPSLVLAHSARNISPHFRDSITLATRPTTPVAGEEESRAQCAAWLADHRKKALLAHIGVGTIDQALAAILPAYHQSLRLLGLQRKVLIVDEVHAYDTYMHTLLQSLLKFHAALGGCAILLSASLPQRMRRELAAAFACGAGLPTPELVNNHYPLVTHISSEYSEHELAARPQLCRTVNLRFLHDENSVHAFIRQELAAGKCVCWIRNTVHDACSAYQALVNTVSHLSLFHARFAMGDRLTSEGHIHAAFGPTSTPACRRGRLLIATQVVEQSLDLDFDELVSDLAPIDRIIQRAGRLHRHARPERPSVTPTLTVFAPPFDDNPPGDWYARLFPKAAHVYPVHTQLWRTAQCLCTRHAWRQPDDIRAMIETVYHDAATAPEALMRRDQRAFAELLSAQSLAQFNALELYDGYNCTSSDWADDNFAPSRLGDDTVTLRLARWDGQKLTPWCATARFPWAMSDVSVRRALVAREDQYSGTLAAAVAAAKSGMPDACRHALLIVLQHSHDDVWRGHARTCAGSPVLLQYSPICGLTVLQGDSDALQSD